MGTAPFDRPSPPPSAAGFWGDIAWSESFLSHDRIACTSG
jgi:hypothetical protein